MVARASLGRQFGWLWAAYAVSTLGTWLAFDAFSFIAILVLHAGPAEVSMLAAVGLIVGAALALPLGPWVEFHRKWPVMVATDLTRFAALMSVPAAFALGLLTFAQLLVVSAIVAAASITSRAATGACLKALVRPEHLLVANGRFESTTWTATRWGRNRPVRSGNDRGRRCGQLPALGSSYLRDRQERAASRASRGTTAPGRRA